MFERMPQNLHSDQPLSVFYSFPHALGAPGIGTTAWNQIASLIADGHLVTVVTTSISRPIPGASRVVRTLALGSRRIPHRLIGRDRAFDWHDTVASRLLSKGTFDVVHTWPLGGERTLLTAEALGIAAVREAPNTHTAHAYEVVEEEYRSLGLPVPQNSHHFNASHLAREEREWAAATAILVPSEHVATTFGDQGIDCIKLLHHQYGYNPADIPNIALKPAAARPSTTSTTGASRPFTVVFAGQGTPRKGLHYALQAWHAMGPERGDGIFRIHGAVESGYAAFLGPLLDHPSVQQQGFTSPASAIYNDADVLILPTIEEGSALVTYEAQAAGLALLVSSVSGAIVEHDVHGLVHEPRDVVALTAQLTELARTPAMLERLRKGALSHAPDLTWSAANLALVRCYRHAILMRQSALEPHTSEPTTSTHTAPAPGTPASELT
jgi:glycosyltransferase involved in cell wall biosynthesis